MSSSFVKDCTNVSQSTPTTTTSANKTVIIIVNNESGGAATLDENGIQNILASHGAQSSEISVVQMGSDGNILSHEETPINDLSSLISPASISMDEITSVTDEGSTVDGYAELPLDADALQKLESVLKMDEARKFFCDPLLSIVDDPNPIEDPLQNFLSFTGQSPDKTSPVKPKKTVPKRRSQRQVDKAERIEVEKILAENQLMLRKEREELMLKAAEQKSEAPGDENNRVSDKDDGEGVNSSPDFCGFSSSETGISSEVKDLAMRKLSFKKNKNIAKNKRINRKIEKGIKMKELSIKLEKLEQVDLQEQSSVSGGKVNNRPSLKSTPSLEAPVRPLTPLPPVTGHQPNSVPESKLSDSTKKGSKSPLHLSDKSKLLKKRAKLNPSHVKLKSNKLKKSNLNLKVSHSVIGTSDTKFNDNVNKPIIDDSNENNCSILIPTPTFSDKELTLKKPQDISHLKNKNNCNDKSKTESDNVVKSEISDNKQLTLTKTSDLNSGEKKTNSILKKNPEHVSPSSNSDEKVIEKSGSFKTNNTPKGETKKPKIPFGDQLIGGDFTSNKKTKSSIQKPSMDKENPLQNKDNTSQNKENPPNLKTSTPVLPNFLKKFKIPRKTPPESFTSQQKQTNHLNTPNKNTHHSSFADVGQNSTPQSLTCTPSVTSATPHPKTNKFNLKENELSSQVASKSSNSHFIPQQNINDSNKSIPNIIKIKSSEASTVIRVKKEENSLLTNSPQVASDKKSVAPEFFKKKRKKMNSEIRRSRRPVKKKSLGDDIMYLDEDQDDHSSDESDDDSDGEDVKEASHSDDNASESGEEIEDDPERLWCICHKPHNNRFMICCDRCEDWFHGACVGISKQMGKQMEQEEREWLCPKCKDNDSSSPSTLKYSAKNGKSPVSSNPKEANVAPAKMKSKKNKSLVPPKKSKAPKEKTEPRVLVYEKSTGVVLSGTLAPTLDVLGEWLQENPHYTPLQPAMMNSIKHDPKTGLKKINLQEFGLKPEPPVKSDIKFKPKMAKTLKLCEVSELETKRKMESNKKKVSPIIKEKFYKKDAKSRGLSPSKSTEVRKKSLDSPDENFDPKINKDTPKKGFKSPDPSIGKVIIKADSMKVRVNVQKVLFDALEKRKSEVKPEFEKMTDTDLKELCGEIEEQLYIVFNKDVGFKYKSRYRSLVFNIKDSKNSGLFRKILNRTITPSKLATMTSDDLASNELAEWREREEKKELEAIQKHELERIALGNQYIMKSHKGEMVIDKDEFSSSKSKDTESVISLKATTSILDTSVKEENDEDEDEVNHKNHIYDPNCRICAASFDSKEKSLEESSKSQDEGDLKKHSSDKKDASRRHKKDKERRHSHHKHDRKHRSRSHSGSRKRRSRSRSGSRKRRSRSRSGSRKRRSRSRSHSGSRHKSSRHSRHSRDKDDRKRKHSESTSRDSRKKKEEKHTTESKHDEKHTKEKKNEKHTTESKHDEKHTAERKHDEKHTAERKHDEKHTKEKKPDEKHIKEKKPDEKHTKEKKPDDKHTKETKKDEKVIANITEETTPLHDDDSTIILPTITITPEDSPKEITDKIESPYTPPIPLDEGGAPDVEDDTSIQLLSPATPPLPGDDDDDRLTPPPPNKGGDLPQGPTPIWKGMINMPDVSKFGAAGFEVSGKASYITEDVPSVIEVIGRINPDNVWSYIAQVKKSGSKEILVVRFQPSSEEEKVSYIALYSYLSSKKRYGVIGNCEKTVKDFYIIPLASHQPIPQILLPLDGPGFEESRPHMLIAVIVRAKQRRIYDPIAGTFITVGEAPLTSHHDSKHQEHNKDRSLTPPLPPSSHLSKRKHVIEEALTPSPSTSNEAAQNEPNDKADRESMLEELNRQIERDKQELSIMQKEADEKMEKNEEEIIVLEDADDTDESLPPSDVSNPLDKINIPSNLQDILNSIKKKEEVIREKEDEIKRQMDLEEEDEILMPKEFPISKDVDLRVILPHKQDQDLRRLPTNDQAPPKDMDMRSRDPRVKLKPEPPIPSLSNMTDEDLLKKAKEMEIQNQQIDPSIPPEGLVPNFNPSIPTLHPAFRGPPPGSFTCGPPSMFPSFPDQFDLIGPPPSCMPMDHFHGGPPPMLRPPMPMHGPPDEYFPFPHSHPSHFHGPTDIDFHPEMKRHRSHEGRPPRRRGWARDDRDRRNHRWNDDTRHRRDSYGSPREIDY